MKKWYRIVILALAALWVAMPIHAREKVGLVLSGGGAKGIAHVGIIKALEDNGIPIDYVTGTSMGSIVGALYSCGFSPEEMLALFTSRDFSYWSTGTIDEKRTFYILKPEPTAKWVQVNASFDKNLKFSSDIMPGSLINPLPMNFEFLRLFSPYTLQCGSNFDNLFVPFRCVTSDIYHKHKIVCRNGDLGDAVRASMSFPLVYKPIKMNGVLVYDGGIYDNFPVDVMTDDFHPDFMIGVSVSKPDGKPVQDNLYSQLEDMIIQNNDYSLPSQLGIKIQVPVSQFGVLDFDKARTIYDIGYNTGLQMLDSIKARTSARISAEDVARRREAFKKATPLVEFKDVEVTEASDAQAQYIKELFTPEDNKLLDMNAAENAYYKALSTNRFSDLLPQMKTEEGAKDPTLMLNANIKKQWSMGVGGWVTTSTQSMLYLNLGYHNLSFRSIDADISGWLGQTYYAGMLNARLYLKSAIPSFIDFQAVMSRQKYYESELLFYETDTPAFITKRENFLRANYNIGLGKKAKAFAGLGYGYLTNSYFENNAENLSGLEKDKSKYRTLQLRLGVESNTLDHPMYPSSGAYWRVLASGSMEDSRFLPEGVDEKNEPWNRHWRLFLEAEGKKYFPIGDYFSVGVMGDAVVTLQKRFQNYMATLVQAPLFAPTPSTRNYFNVKFRSNSYLAAGVIPIWKPISNLQLRGDFYLYAPIRDMKEGPEPDYLPVYDGWFRRLGFIGEVAAVYNFPFASLSLYCNYLTAPSHNWNFGLSFGMFIQAPKFLR